VNQFNPQLRTASDIPLSECYLGGESGFLHEDPIAYIDNPTPWTQPKVLLQGWFDQVEWPSLGVIPTPTPFALGDLKPQPVFNDPKTWRDPWFEAALKAKPF
jgi:hypothetical protein